MGKGTFELYYAILEGLQEYMAAKCKYDVSVVEEEPSEPEYPLLIFKYLRDVPLTSKNGIIDKVSSVDFRLDIHATQIDDESKTRVVQSIAATANDYLEIVLGLKKTSYNEHNYEGVLGGMKMAIITYSAQYLEPKQRII